MSLTAGTRIGPYEITALLGAGGMGEVYRARDARLNRDVALKVLPEALADDAERLARFEREAQVLASLNHPNIAAIHGIEEGPAALDGARAGEAGRHVRALVLELVEGDTLEDRVARGSMPIDEALAVARQIADALEAAHEAGVVHRDLKPANVKVTPAGHVKVLDFGLAKMREPAASAPAATQAPTITTPAMMTGVGMILGTAAYMSPEQARGKPVDRRADIWAFGCVLYEMLTAKRAFADEDVSLTLSKVLQREPDFDALPVETPASVRQTLRLCLKKDPKLRLQAIGDVRLALEGVFESHQTPLAGTMAVPRRGWRPALELAGVAVLAVLGTGVSAWFLTRPAPAPATRLTAVHPGPETLSVGGSQSIVLSPDGRRILYQAATAGRRRIYVRELDQLSVAPLGSIENIENAYAVFLSPDGQWVGFIDQLSGGSLKKIAITGGPVITVCRLPPTMGASGASWGADGTIVLGSGNPGGGLWRVNAAGGTPEALTTPDPQKGEGRHGSPDILPGGQAVVFANVPNSNRSEEAQIEVLNLATGERKTLVQGGNHPRYVASGHLLYEVQGTLRAVVFDLDRLAVAGNPVPVAEGLVASPWEGAFSVAPNGTLVYLQGISQIGATRTLVWVDRQGREEALELPPRAYAAARLSPDGTRVALEVRDENFDIWVWHLIRQTLTRLTFDPEANFGGVWSPDGQRLAFSRGADGENIYWQAADGTGTPERLTQRSRPQRPSAFAPDASALLFHEPPTGSQDVGIVTLNGDRKSALILQTPFDEENAEVSPDGRWLAYQSNESGREEIYVRPFPDVGSGRWQVSTGGGTRPLWARSGRELFYYVPPGTIVAVPIEAGSAFAAGTPRPLSTGDYLAPTASRQYDVSPDGQRFLMIKAAPGEAAAPPQLIVVQNWLEELKRLVPAN